MAKKQKTKRQHYVPLLALRRFTSNGQLHYLDIDENQVIGPKGAKSVCFEYEFYGEDSEDSMEGRLKELENRVAPAQQKLISEGRLDNFETTTFLEYLAVLHQRTTAARERVKEEAWMLMRMHSFAENYMDSSVFSDLSEESIGEIKRQKLAELTSAKGLKQVHTKSIKGRSSRTFKHLKQMQFAVHTNNSVTPYVISDSAMVVTNLDHSLRPDGPGVDPKSWLLHLRNVMGRTDWVNKDGIYPRLVIYLPLTPNCLLALSPTLALASKEPEVSLVNMMSASQAIKYVVSKDKELPNGVDLGVRRGMKARHYFFQAMDLLTEGNYSEIIESLISPSQYARLASNCSVNEE